MRKVEAVAPEFGVNGAKADIDLRMRAAPGQFSPGRSSVGQATKMLRTRQEAGFSHPESRTIVKTRVLSRT